MDASVIDTLRYASRLRDAGFQPQQAEAMSRALNDEIGSGVATKADLDHAVGELQIEFAKVVARVDVMEARFDGVDERFVAVDARFDAMDAKFDAMDAKFDALAGKLDTQGRYVFLVLALIAALGFFNAVYPQVTSKEPPIASVQPPRATAPAPVPEAEGG